MKDKNFGKIFIIIIVVILIVISILFMKKLNSKTIYSDENKKYEINYFVEYSSDGTVGVVNKKGEEIIETKYADIYIPNPEKDVFFCFEDEDNVVIINSKGEELFKNYKNVSTIMTSDGMLEFEKEVLKFYENGKYGLLDLDGNVVVQAEYDNIESLNFKPGKLLVKKNNFYGVIDIKGNIVVDIKYSSIEGDGFCTENDGYTKTGYIVKEKKDTGYYYGYINPNGKLVLKTEYESVERILNYTDTNNIYLVGMKNGKKGFYKNGKNIIDNKYQSITYSESSNIIIAKTSRNYLFYNLDGKQILDSKYEEYSLAGNYISVLEAGARKLYDTNGNFLTNIAYKSIKETGNPNYFITVDENNRYSIMNKSTELKDTYLNLKYAFDDYFIFTTDDNKAGVLNVWTGIVVEPEYESILKIDNINALEAKKENQTTIYSKELEKISTISDAIVESVKEKYAVVYSNTDMIYLDENGKEISNKNIYENKLYSIKKDGKWGFQDKSGNIVVECNYDIVTELNNYGFAGIKKDGKWGIIDSSGNLISEPKYEIETYYFPSFIGKTYIELTDSLHCIKLED